MSESKRDKRIQQITDLLHNHEKLRLGHIAETLGVSEMTLRRDLTNPPPTMSLLGGYIFNKQFRTTETGYEINEQNANHVKEKHQIGEIAALEVTDNSTIFFDNGTTTVHVIHAIDDELRFTGVCFSLNVFLALKNKPNCHAILCGGQFDDDHNHFYPVSDISEIDNFRFDLMFMSAAGVSLEQGITCYALTELPYKQKAMKQSQKVVLVADSSKFERVKRAATCQLADVDEIISEVPLRDAYLQAVGLRRKS
ncbi:DNA-binding transcriptional repressor DeoR [Photobacterium sanctipauli]|uniref:DNA-binding transcriptional repressor DeoR n=1 Tax=Photobacterium sanctipauli TaxID=1342794 RepID=A0A2T3NPP4_9GAMM|nr:DNA-binding transcriptional repressor DeoR [Photobacterium sanctipauli]PSW18230.1 DNA-binding transcriptional repressor DeoR [Photobacterium sanctipauli]